MTDEVHEVEITPTGEPDPHDMPEIVDAITSNGITIQNHTGEDCIIAVANTVLGVSAIGYARNKGEVTLPASWAWWDVYALPETKKGELFIKHGAVSTIRYVYKKTMVGYRATVKIP